MNYSGLRYYVSILSAVLCTLMLMPELQASQAVAALVADPTEIVIVGDSLTSDVPSTFSPLIFDLNHIASTGATTVAEFFGTIPQNFSSSHLNSSYDLDVPRIPEWLNSHGLPVLFLLDGRRLGPNPDLATIPLSAIDRIEITEAGASAVYGSDAVGGVVNLVLREDYRHAEAEIRSATSSGGGASQLAFTQSFGRTAGRNRFFATLGCHESEGVSADRRGFSRRALNSSQLVPDTDACAMALNIGRGIGERWTLYANAFLNQRGLSYVAALGQDSSLLSFDFDTRQANINAEANRKGKVWTFKSAVSLSESKLRFQLSSQDADPLLSDVTSRDRTFAGEITLTRTVYRSAWGKDATVTFGARYQKEDPFLAEGKEKLGLSPLASNSTFGVLTAPLSEKLIVTVAGRGDDPHGFRSNKNRAVGLRYEATNWLTFNAVRSTASRAPTHLQLSDAVSVNTFLGQDQERLLLLTGNHAQDAEKSVSRVFSTTFTIGNGFTALVNLFRTEFTGQLRRPDITLDSPFTSERNLGLITLNDGGAEFQELMSSVLVGHTPVVGCSVPPDPATGFCNEPVGAVRGILDGRLTNFASTVVSGADIYAKAIRKIGSATLSGTLNVSYLDHFKQQATPFSPTLDLVDTVGNPADLRARLIARLAARGMELAGTIEYTDSYDGATPGTKIPAWRIFSIHASYEFGAFSQRESRLRGLMAAVSVHNVLDEPPPYVQRVGSGPNTGYDAANADPYGRVISVGVTKAW